MYVVLTRVRDMDKLKYILRIHAYPARDNHLEHTNRTLILTWRKAYG
jgi:hypothetical protein